MKRYILCYLMAVLLLVAAQASGQSAGGHAPANAADILHALPPDLYKKLQQLSQLLDHNIKVGRLTEAQIQQELMSGHLEQTIRSLGPEANQLFDEIHSDMMTGKGPGEEALIPLLGGLTGMGK